MTIHISKDGSIVGVPFTPALKTLFPGANVLANNGFNHILLPNHNDTVKLLRNMGVEVPAPALSRYHFPHMPGKPPFEVQKKTVALLTMNQRCYVLNGMGTGKTKAAIWAFDYLKQCKLAQKMLVVAPLSTLDFVWMKEVFESCTNLKAVVLHGSKEKRLKRLAEDHDIYIINHDGVGVIFKELMVRQDIDYLCIDEASKFRNSRSAKTKILTKLAAKMTWAFGMTGSPTPKEPTDVYGQARVITPDRVPPYFKRFRDALMLRVSTFKWVPRADSVEKAYAVLQPAVRYTLDDVVELPELIEREIEVELGPRQKNVYEKMVLHSRVIIANGDVTAVNAGALINKLMQISTGYVYDSGRNVVTLDNDKRLDTMVDDIDACDEKVIVFVPYIHALNGIMARLTKEGIDAVQVSGATPVNKRGQIFNLFQNTTKYKVIVAHPDCMSHGLTLTAATLIIWFSPVMSLETFDQANARIRRVGQKKKQLIHLYWGTKIERKVIKMLRAKQAVQSKLLELFEEGSE